MTDHLKDVLDDHLLWLQGEGGQRADFTDADLRNANLRCAGLNGADLRRADLRCADLQDADLNGADLRRADLRDADLRSANLRGANLIGADLRCADLLDADLLDADLEGANGLLPLPVAEPRCYRWVAVAHHDGWHIAAGCRWFTAAEARQHWLSPDYAGPQSVKDTVGAALDWLEMQPLPEMESTG